MADFHCLRCDEWTEHDLDGDHYRCQECDTVTVENNMIEKRGVEIRPGDDLKIRVADATYFPVYVTEVTETTVQMYVNDLTPTLQTEETTDVPILSGHDKDPEQVIDIQQYEDSGW